MSRHEFLRKLFHLAGLLLFFSFYLVGPIAAELVRMAILSSEPAYVPLWGSLDLVHVFAGARDAGKQLTLFALLCTVSITCIVDLPRLFLGDDYSIVNLIEKQAGRILREKERGAPGPQVFISISATAAWITCLMLDGNVPLAMEIGVATGLVSTLSDGVAAIVGKYFGKHKVIRGDDVKSIEGFISGAGSAFFIALPFVGPVLASIAAGIFLLVDVLSPAVADNVINPLLIAPALLLVASFL